MEISEHQLREMLIVAYCSATQNSTIKFNGEVLLRDHGLNAPRVTRNDAIKHVKSIFGDNLEEYVHDH